VAERPWPVFPVRVVILLRPNQSHNTHILINHHSWSRRLSMKSDAIGRVLDKLRDMDRASRAQEALEAAQTKGHVPEDPGADPNGPPDSVPAAHRPDLPDAATDFDPITGLPYVAMDRFPLPHEDEDTDLDVFA
jgi:hypothetical protein